MTMFYTAMPYVACVAVPLLMVVVGINMLIDERKRDK